MNTKTLHQIEADRPLTAVEQDRLGFASSAQEIATSILERTSSDGLVIGLEGSWGSGKSSLLALTIQYLEVATKESPPVILRFEPWLIGERDALLASLFGELATAIELQDAGVERASSDAKKLAEKVRGFAANLGPLAKLSGLAALAIPGAGAVAETLSKVVELSSALSPERTPLATQKREIGTALSKLGRPFVVAVDDVDRLEPQEAIEVLRLVRSVADFPHITYVVCYDERVLGHNVEKATGVESGLAYLEKVVQVVYRVPAPEPFDLRRWFATDLGSIVGAVPEEEWARIRHVVDAEGGKYLTTPRSVVRMLNSLRMVLPRLRSQVDIADLIWLEFQKISNPPFYRWIESYVASVAVSWPGRTTVSKENVLRSEKELLEVLSAGGRDIEEEQWGLSEHLPGIGFAEGTRTYQNLSGSNLRQAIDGRRLASPDHYRLYFALSAPFNSPTTSDWEALWQAADSNPATIPELLKRWSNQITTNGASKAEVVLYRLRNFPTEVLTPTRAKALLLALSQVMDVPPLTEVEHGLFGGPRAWYEVERLLPVLLEAMTKKLRKSALSAAFREGTAVGWLTFVLRDQIFAHGRAGESERGDKYLSADELDAASNSMIRRYRKLSLDQLFALPRGNQMLFAWAQGGDPSGPRKLVEGAIKDEDGLLRTLEQLAGRATSSRRGEYMTLSRSSLDYFLEYEDARTRVARLAAGRTKLRSKAQRILQMFKDGER